MNSALQSIRTSLHARFPERKPVIEGALCAILASEHVLLLGPPGTAKSALVRALAQSFSGTYFEHLLTRFSTPEELFGPMSLKALEQDQFTRITTGKLPEAHFGFVDEVFKANSAMLNGLLALMNERMFHNSGAPTSCPLVSLFGASNELPEGNELDAVFDRFSLRFQVNYLLNPSNLRAILTSQPSAVPPPLDLATLQTLQAEVNALPVTDDTLDALLRLREECKQEGIIASDRRWKQSLKLVKAAAYLAEATETAPQDLAVLVDSLWREPDERPIVARVVGKLADPVTTQANEILDSALEMVAKTAAIKTQDRQAYLTQATKTITAFEDQKKKLAELAKAAGKRAQKAVAVATHELSQLHTQLARELGNGLGLRIGGAH